MNKAMAMFRDMSDLGAHGHERIDLSAIKTR
jgi:hypothetical protein